MFKDVLHDILHGLLFPALAMGTVVEDDRRTITGNDDIPVIAVEPGRLHLGDDPAEPELPVHADRIDLRRQFGAHPVLGFVEYASCVSVYRFRRTYQPEHMV